METYSEMFVLTMALYFGYHYFFPRKVKSISSLSDDEKKDVFEDIMTQLNSHKKKEASDEEGDLDSDEEVDLDYDEEADEEAELEADESVDNDRDEAVYVKFPKLSRVRRGYYRVRFEDSDNPSINFVSIKDKNLFDKIQLSVNKQVHSHKQ